MALKKDLLKFSRFSSVFDFTNLSNTGNLKNVGFSISVRTAKHYNPKFKWLRSKKYIPIELPHTEAAKERRKNFLRDIGIYPRYWKPRPLTLTSATHIFDPYRPQLGDGKFSTVSKVKDLAASSKAKIANTTAMRKIKNYDQNFKNEVFLAEAQDIYINAHKVLMEKDPEALSQYATEKAITEMMDGVKNTTLRWSFIKSLEPPEIVQARVSEVLIKTNLFAQVTIRFHTKQTLAIYDRFGRLMFGNETIAKDVLEYVVFEKHINNMYGVWKLHGKIIPEWCEPTLKYTRTYRIQDVVEEDEEDHVPVHEEDPKPDPEYKETSEVVQAHDKS